MSNAAIDSNSKETLTARLNTDGKTVIRIEADASSHGIMVNVGTTGSDNGGTNAAFDENGRTTTFVVSSIDGKTLVALYADSSGNLLIDSM